MTTGIAERTAAVAIAGDQPELPGIDRDLHGKPVLPIQPAVLYRFGHLIRLSEQLLLDLFGKGLLSGTTHTCIGQELCQMAVVRALNDPGDVVLSNHRNHGHFLTYSGAFEALVAEIMGRQTGVCGGIGGSQHIAYRHFHSNGVQAGMTAIGAGLSLALSLRKSRSVVACFVGDGTFGEGLLYESLNLASVWRTRMLFVVEDNRIAQTTPTASTTGGSLIARGAAFGLRTWELDDAAPDFMRAAEEVVEAVRTGGEPGFLVIQTRRLGPHSKGDDLREAAELDAIRARDPLMRLGDTLPGGERAAIEADNHAYIQRILGRAMQAPESHVVIEPTAPSLRSSCSMKRPQESGSTNVRARLNDALRRILKTRPEALLLGEDLHDPYGGAFKVTKGLSTEFSTRVMSTPISEAGVVGAGIGLALAGFRPIVEIMFADFISLAMDQLYNHAVKFPGMFRDCAVPLVVRTPCGGRRGYGPTHSQSPENLLVALPGLTVVFGSHRHDVGLLLERASVEWNQPVVFLEHKLLYGEKMDPGDYIEAPPHASDPGADFFPTLVRGRNRPDLSIVTYGGMLPIIERAAARLESEDFVVEIIAPSLLRPLPIRTLAGLLNGRERIAIVEETYLGPGVGSELAASLLERAFAGRATRIATLPQPIPAARSLEARLLPDEDELFQRLACFITDAD
jgi:2-oxoisovalerate dehydrogenase E1 component